MIVSRNGLDLHDPVSGLLLFFALIGLFLLLFFVFQEMGRPTKFTTGEEAANNFYRLFLWLGTIALLLLASVAVKFHSW